MQPPDGDEPGRTSQPAERSEDFLYHLYRGSTMLLQDDVEHAKLELERALALQPQDAKSQDLLAGVYFRLGFYPRAIEIWARLVVAFPRQVTLRVNLALALFKTGQADEALEHIHEALRIQPDHERAWGYLGLVHWRLGNLEAARDAFLRGGQASMARRMEDELQSDGLPRPVEAADLEAQDRDAMRSAAEEALERLESEHPHLALESATGSKKDTKTSGVWQPTEPGEEAMPRRPGARAEQVLPPPESLAAKLGTWALENAEDEPLAVGPAGQLLLGTKRDVYLRMSGLAGVRGELRTTVVQRRRRGRELDELLGEREPLMFWRGPIRALFVPTQDRAFSAFRLGSDVLYVREDVLFGFDDRVSFESASLPLTNDPVPVTMLSGDGTVVLALRHTPMAVHVHEGDELHVDPDKLVGWSGRLFPTPRSGTAPYSAHAPPLAFRGDGVVILSSR